MISSSPRRHFDPLGQPWRNCYAEMGRMYPQSEMTEWNGHWYCQAHAQAHLDRDELSITPDIQEDPDANGADFTAVIPDTFGNTDR